MTAGRPPADATDVFLAELEALRRRAGLRVSTVARAVTALDDAVGWARLTAFGTQATVEAQQAALDAVAAYLEATLESAGVPSLGVVVPGSPGLLASGRSVFGLFSVTEGVVRRRMAAGADFLTAMDASATYLTGIASSEPHRVGRDGQLAAGLSDPRFDRYRRIASPGACDFCLMLATRGAVYLSEESAGESRKYHLPRDHCRVELVVSADAIDQSKALSGDWHNAIRDEPQMRAAGAIQERPA